MRRNKPLMVFLSEEEDQIVSLLVGADNRTRSDIIRRLLRDEAKRRGLEVSDEVAQAVSLKTESPVRIHIKKGRSRRILKLGSRFVISEDGEKMSIDEYISKNGLASPASVYYRGVWDNEINAWRMRPRTENKLSGRISSTPIYDEFGVLFASSLIGAAKKLGVAKGSMYTHLVKYQDGYRLVSRPSNRKPGQKAKEADNEKL